MISAMMNVRTWMMAVMLSLGIVVAANGQAGDKATILKIADALERGDDAQAKKLAAELKRSDLEDLMNLMLPRKAGGKGGLGIGPNPGAIQPDGIEKKVHSLAKRPPTAGEAAALEKAGYVMQAIALSTEDKLPKGQKKVKLWKQFNADFLKNSKDFTEAAKKKDFKAIQAISVKLENVCIECHKL